MVLPSGKEVPYSLSVSSVKRTERGVGQTVPLLSRLFMLIRGEIKIETTYMNFEEKKNELFLLGKVRKCEAVIMIHIC